MAASWSSVALVLLCILCSLVCSVLSAAAAPLEKPSSREEVIASFRTWVASVGAKHAAFENAAKATAGGSVDELARKVGETVIVVDQSGAGNYKTINEAFNAVPAHNKNPITIQVNAGTYV